VARKKAAKALYTALVSDAADVTTRAGPTPPAVQRVIDNLLRLETALTRAREAASKADDLVAAAAIRPILQRTRLLLISVDKELIRMLDEASDAAAAEQKMVAINGALDAEADRIARKADGLEKTAAVLDQLARLAGMLAKKSG
jgi:hypothetical protein